jgi:hypothetical protein
MAGIQCKVDIPKLPGLDDASLTVGREFYLNCTGEWPKDLQQDKLSFSGDENLKYQIKLLGFEFRTPNDADLKVVSYLPGEHKLPNLVLTDGAQKLELGPVEFQLQSVIQQGEKVEPFGPMGPATIPVPLFYWIFILAVVVFLGLAGALRVWRYQQRRAMLLRLKQHESALTPLQEFHQSMRKLQRVNPAFYDREATAEEFRQGLDELSRMFKMYVSRRLSVPAFEWNERLILADLRRYHPQIFTDYSRKIRDLFGEFKKAEGANAKLHSKDVVQLSESLRKVLENIEKSLNAVVESDARRGRR